MDCGRISLRPFSEDDIELLFRFYASTREQEMRFTGWGEPEIEQFLRMQFRLQHTCYLQSYPGASFDVVLFDGIPAGRLYVQRKESEIRIIDISLLPAFRGMGIGSRLLSELIEEADRDRMIVSLHVEARNPALALYERFGFRKWEFSGIHCYMERMYRAGR